MGYRVSSLAAEPALSLTLVGGEAGLDREVTTAELNRPALELTGYLSRYRAERIQIFGSGEYAYLMEHLGQGEARAQQACEFIFGSETTPCVIFSKANPPPPLVVALADQYRLPLFVTPLTTSKLSLRLWDSLEPEFAPRTLVHGSLLDIFGLGVLIRGASGVGKSECALELVTRGHILVADDVVDIRCLGGSILIGACSPVISHHMEIRGLGVIDVQRMFGAKAVRPRKRIRLVVTLEDGAEENASDRLGIDDHRFEILEVDLPHIIIPVRPGRDIGTIIEVGALNQNLKSMGIHSSRELDDKLREVIDKKKSRLSEAQGSPDS